VLQYGAECGSLPISHGDEDIIRDQWTGIIGGFNFGRVTILRCHAMHLTATQQKHRNRVFEVIKSPRKAQTL